MELSAAEPVEAGGEVGPGEQGGHVRIAVGQHDRGRHRCIMQAIAPGLRVRDTAGQKTGA
jgi:hypothetical protein